LQIFHNSIDSIHSRGTGRHAERAGEPVAITTPP